MMGIGFTCILMDDLPVALGWARRSRWGSKSPCSAPWAGLCGTTPLPPSSRRFDVMVAENTFGDILTDEASVLAASMGLLPSARLADVSRAGGRIPGFYEPIHGTAPDIAGHGIANPIASILSVAMMARYSLGLTEEAAGVEIGVEQVLADGYRTADIAVPGSPWVGTGEMGDRILAALERGR